MRSGYKHELHGDTARITVRRCNDDEGSEVIELTCETTDCGWFMSSVLLTPEQAIGVATDLLQEAVEPLPADVGLYPARKEFAGA